MILSRPPVTIILVALSILVFLMLQILGRESVMLPLMISRYYQPVLPEIVSGEIWRLITPIFLHFSIFHITFNMLWAWEFGKVIESRQGRISLILITVVLAVTSNLLQYFVSGPVFGGMSGVIYGYFGYVWIQGQYNPRFGIRLNPNIIKLMLGWFLLCWSGLLERFFGLNIANTAHSAGLFTGIAMAFILVWLRRQHKRPTH